jgi:hypothetical protein
LNKETHKNEAWLDGNLAKAGNTQDTVGQSKRTKVVITCQYLYSNDNADLICVSQLFGASQYWWFIAGSDNRSLEIRGEDT